DRARTDDDARQPVGRSEEFLDSLLGREASGEENVRRVGGSADMLGYSDAARNDAYVPRAEGARVRGERVRRRNDEPRPPQDPSREPWNAPRELDVRPPHLHDERPAQRRRDRAGREP